MSETDDRGPMTDEQLAMNADDAVNIWNLASLPEERTDEEHAALLRLADWLDANVGAYNPVTGRSFREETEDGRLPRAER
jgi:hypothetical protein